MEQKLQMHLAAHFPMLPDSKILLAVSGGIDSIVMVNMFKNLQYNIAIAHCNFQLRKLESIQDQLFVERLASTNDIPFFTTIFDTKAFAEDYKLSIQVAARELRYNWFYELAEEHHFDYILTAHHADDNLETFLINLSRGTGIDGLTGIPHVNEKVLRPLLPFKRAEIEAYASENNLEWREDSSNASDQYLRNKIRHDLVPVLKSLNPNFTDILLKTQDYLQQTQAMADDAAIMVYRQVAQQANDEIHYNLKKLRQLPNYRSYLYHWLREFGFTAWDDIYALAEAHSGKQIFAPNHKLLKNRDFFIVSPLHASDEPTEYWIESTNVKVKVPLKLEFTKTDKVHVASNKTIFVDADKLSFPLQLRKWNDGDVFYPIGMEGRSKKVGKYFKDEKFSLNDKDRTWLLCSDDKIVWIVGSRADERFKVTATTTNILQIALQ